MRIVIFSGTTEGRKLSRRLSGRGAEILVSVATDYGREEQGISDGVTVLTGRKNREEMAEILQNAALCVDATHPYAVDATKNIQAACELAKVPYRRLLREAGSIAGNADTLSGNIVTVANASGAAAYLERTEGNILLTTGAKELCCYAALNPLRLYPRILPTHEGLSACENLGIPHRNILALQGPFSRELNEALIHQYQVAWLVTKDGGKTGGFPEKLQAAQHTGVTVILLRRPEETGESFTEIAAFCEKLLCENL